MPAKTSPLESNQPPPSPPPAPEFSAAESSVAVEAGLSADATLSPEATVLDDHASWVAEVERIRTLRRPFGGLTQKLALPKRPGYHRHWFNDVAGRIDQAIRSGYSHIKDRDGTPMKRVVGTGRDKGALNAFAMEIPEVIWEEDMLARHKDAQARIDAIKESPARARAGQAVRSDQGKFYNPVEETGASPITVTRGT